MNKNKVRHKVLRLLVENYEILLDKYGENGNFLPPMYSDNVKIPINLILESAKVSYADLKQASTKAIKDKAYKFTENKEHEECCDIAKNTFLYYNEDIYLKQSKWYQRDIWKKIWLLLFAGFISLITTLVVQWINKKEYKTEQNKIDKRQDSLINELKDSINFIKKSLE
ncbi:MAG: hypothetical protein ABI168_06230 [Ginsengibacter sp.]|jgi:hypothetical protein